MLSARKDSFPMEEAGSPGEKVHLCPKEPISLANQGKNYKWEFQGHLGGGRELCRMTAI